MTDEEKLLLAKLKVLLELRDIYDVPFRQLLELLVVYVHPVHGDDIPV